MDKDLYKLVYQFSKTKNLKSFHAVGYGYLPHITLVQLLEKDKSAVPVNYIVLNSFFEEYKTEKKILEENFKIPIVIEYYDSKLFVSL